MIFGKKTVCLLLSSTLLLPACTQVQGGTQEVTQAATQNYDAVQQDVRDMFTYKPPNKNPKPILPSYCYFVMQDILCYHSPVAGAEDRLVAYQGTVEEPDEKKAAKKASASAADGTVQQAEAAPVAPVDATSSASPQSPTPQVPTPLTQTDDQKAQTEKSMGYFDQLKAVFVGPPPAAVPDTVASQ